MISLDELKYFCFLHFALERPRHDVPYALVLFRPEQIAHPCGLLTVIRSPNAPPSRLVLADVCLVGDNPTCSVLALWGFAGLWSDDYGHA